MIDGSVKTVEVPCKRPMIRENERGVLKNDRKIRENGHGLRVNDQRVHENNLDFRKSNNNGDWGTVKRSRDP